jgi:hypothetical protein
MFVVQEQILNPYPGLVHLNKPQKHGIKTGKPGLPFPDISKFILHVEDFRVCRHLILTCFMSGGGIKKTSFLKSKLTQ